MSDGLKWFWLSFADGTRPKGQQFLGAAIVRAGDARAAPVIAGYKKCNPGGEVMIQQFPDDIKPGPGEAYRLINSAEAAAWKPTKRSETK